LLSTISHIVSMKRSLRCVLNRIALERSQRPRALRRIERHDTFGGRDRRVGEHAFVHFLPHGAFRRISVLGAGGARGQRDDSDNGEPAVHRSHLHGPGAA
jgi:hypothetical protein